jgi:hypothetical protein
VAFDDEPDESPEEDPEILCAADMPISADHGGGGTLDTPGEDIPIPLLSTGTAAPTDAPNTTPPVLAPAVLFAGGGVQESRRPHAFSDGSESCDWPCSELAELGLLSRKPVTDDWDVRMDRDDLDD